MFSHIWQMLTGKIVDDLRCGHLQAITELDNRIQGIQSENVEVQGKILAKTRKKLSKHSKKKVEL